MISKNKYFIDAILFIVEILVDGLEKGDYVEILLNKVEYMKIRDISTKILSRYFSNINISY